MLLSSADWPIYTKMDLLLNSFNSTGPVEMVKNFDFLGCPSAGVRL